MSFEVRKGNFTNDDHRFWQQMLVSLDWVWYVGYCIFLLKPHPLVIKLAKLKLEKLIDI